MGGDSELNAPRVAPLRKLKEACASLRQTLKELEASHAAGKIDKAQLKQQRWHAVVLLSAMKAGLRDTFLAGDEWKTRVQDQKDVVETHQLQLQNLLYEKDHLVREIRRCKGFHTSEMDRIQFANGSIPIVVDADVHRQHLDQLTQELETRKRMVAQVKAVKAKIEIVEAATHRKQAFLDGLRGQLDDIEASTTGLQTHMHAPVTATLKLQHEASSHLAAPLYTLFCELQAYEKASGCSKQMQISIVDAKGLKSAAGRVKKREFPGALLAGGRLHSDSIEPPSAKRLKAPSRSPSVATQRESGKAPSRSPSMSRTRPVESGEITGDVARNGHADKEEEGAIVEATPRGMPALIIKEMSEVKIANDDDHDGIFDEDGAADTQPKELWKCADKAVLLTLSLAVDDDIQGTETKEFAVLFQYFPTAQVVTAELVTPSSSSLGKHVLTSLFPGDDGLKLANHAIAYKFASDDDASSLEISFPYEMTEARPYLWAQWICGLHALPRTDFTESQHRPEPSVRNVVQQLIRRLTATTQLKRHLAALAKGDAHTPVHATFARHFPTTIKTKLSGWKEITYPKADTLDLFIAHATTGSQYFRVSFKNYKLQVDAVIQVSPEYPVRAPQFRLRHSESTTTVDNALKEIELEVNTYYDELVARHCDQFLLAHQLRKVQQCVDVVSDGSNGNLPTCFGRARRGKDRRPALVVDPATKEVRHR